MKYMAIAFFLMLNLSLQSQETVTIYYPEANAKAELEEAIHQAQEQNKHVLVQVGGNWCPWCIRLHDFFESETRVDSILKKDYILIRINYSKENKNPQVLAGLGYPQRFGFPVLLVLDQKGQRLHTQDTGLLELDKGYDPEKVSRFLLNWNVASLNPDNFK